MSNPDQTPDGCVAAPRRRRPLTASAAEEMVKTLKALADPVRLRLFSAIAGHAGGEACVCDVTDGIDVSQSTVSHHLKVLRDAGLLTSERRASWVYYAIVPGALQDVSDLLDLTMADLTGITT